MLEITKEAEETPETLQVVGVNSPQGRHGDDGVPEGSGDTHEGCVGHCSLSVVDHGGEYDEGHGEREEQETQLRGAGTQSVAKDTQTLRMPRKLENAEHSKNAKCCKRPRESLVDLKCT